MYYFILGLWTIASMAVPFSLHVLYKWPAISLLPPLPGGEDVDHFFNHNYIMPWCRFSPYIGGILLGYILHKTKNKPIKISKVKLEMLFVQ